jgi:hypothetical protein
MADNAATLAQIGATFNEATRLLVGGVWNTVGGSGNAATITNDLQTVQTELQALINANPAQFQGLTGIHAETIVNQLNLELANVQQVTAGTNPVAPKEINDIQRDIIDIVQGDANLQAMATQGGANGFAPVPPLLNAPTPFQDNAAQTAFINQFVADSNNLGQQAVNLIGSNDTAAVNALVGQIQAYENNLSTFDVQQGGVFQARFQNELDLNGTAGTAARALIQGLQTGNADLIQAAATALADNAADVSGNNHALGSPPSPAPVAPADQPHANLAQIGAIFDDASTMMIGGIWSGNKSAIQADLQATQSDLQGLIKAHPDLFQGLTGIHAETIVHQLNLEMQAVKNVGVDPTAPKEISDIQLDIIDIVQGDANLQNMASQGGATGFTPFPDLLNAPKPFQDSADQTAFLNNFIAESNSFGQQAENLVGSGNHQAIASLIHQIQNDVQQANNFVFAQGGVYVARFANELAQQGTNGTDANALIQGLKSGNVAQVQAAAGALAANAADVSGNNVPVGGGTYDTGQTLPVSTPVASAAGGAHDAPSPHDSHQLDLGAVLAAHAGHMWG